MFVYVCGERKRVSDHLIWLQYVAQMPEERPHFVCSFHTKGLLTNLALSSLCFTNSHYITIVIELDLFMLRHTQALNKKQLNINRFRNFKLLLAFI